MNKPTTDELLVVSKATMRNQLLAVLKATVNNLMPRPDVPGKKRRPRGKVYLGPNGDMAYIDACYKGGRFSVQPGTVPESKAVYYKFFSANYNSQERGKIKEVEVAMLRMRWYLRMEEDVNIGPDMIMDVYNRYYNKYTYNPVDESIPLLVDRMCWLNRACIEVLLAEMEKQDDVAYAGIFLLISMNSHGIPSYTMRTGKT